MIFNIIFNMILNILIQSKYIGDILLRASTGLEDRKISLLESSIALAQSTAQSSTMGSNTDSTLRPYRV